MAELVDALVSNTNGSNTVPVRSRLRVRKTLDLSIRQVKRFVLAIFRRFTTATLNVKTKAASVKALPMRLD